ncbi:Hsp33 family molecular chaperone HslO [Eubacterium sp.]|uniref:Hsp33 family molecular chaperone HslO n=1 Tax=Eubacterium sp. TaxID=142586 RepID=UPI001DF5F292|nr:Hsp33 family molecular chaperone HslO [Eubacterium sp.]MBS5620756.1 Hsp33 family molecular chaperone HslO [Eubacterium sp.]
MDYIVRAVAADKQIRAFAITSREMVETARQHHNTSPVATAALGRLLTGGAMMGVMMKGEKDMLTLMMKGDGPINGVTVTADSKGNVKGYVGNPNVLIPANYAGKLDVGAAIGYGTLTVIKDMGLKEPYVSQVPLGTSEVAEDLTYYFASSEQVPSAVGLGVLMSKGNTVKQAGGFIVQLMPFADEEVINKLEERVNNISSVTEMLEKGMTPEDILKEVMGDMDVEFTDKIETGFVCNCGKEKIAKALAGISKKDMDEIINDGKEIEVKCDFCNTTYKFSVEELQTLRKQFR